MIGAWDDMETAAFLFRAENLHGSIKANPDPKPCGI